MAASFDGEVALVTGGSSGIGRAAALAFAAAGARVVVAARRRDELEETVGLIGAAGGDAIAVVTDVTQAVDVEALVARTIEHYGALNFAFNNAGMHGIQGTAETYPEATWDQVTETNLKCLPELEVRTSVYCRRCWCDVNMTSIAGLTGSGLLAYGASKWGVIGLTKSTAIQYAGQGVRVNAVAPAFIDTPMIDRLLARTDEAGADRIRGMQPLGRRLGTPEEVANAVVWLCSSDASFVTGSVLNVDGGFMLAH